MLFSGPSNSESIVVNLLFVAKLLWFFGALVKLEALVAPRWNLWILFCWYCHCALLLWSPVYLKRSQATILFYWLWLKKTAQIDHTNLKIYSDCWRRSHTLNLALVTQTFRILQILVLYLWIWWFWPVVVDLWIILFFWFSQQHLRRVLVWVFISSLTVASTGSAIQKKSRDCSEASTGSSGATHWSHQQHLPRVLVKELVFQVQQ